MKGGGQDLVTQKSGFGYSYLELHFSALNKDLCQWMPRRAM